MESRKTAFSLIELMAVIAVIALLLAFLLPMLSRGKARVDAVRCMNNLRQWGLATHQFAIENNDLLPKDGAPNGASRNEGWYLDLPPLMGLEAYHEMPWRTNASIEPERSAWICPANRRRSNGNNLFHYCLNQNVNRSGTGRQIPLSQIERPDTAVWLFDNGRLAAVAQQNNVHTNLHVGGAQFVFLDAHVERFSAEAYWDFTANRGRTNHPAMNWFP